MTNPTDDLRPADLMINRALTALIDYATALRDSSDDTIDDAQLFADATFDMLSDDDRAFFNADPTDATLSPDLDLPDAILPSSFDDDLDSAAFISIRDAYINLLDSRP